MSKVIFFELFLGCLKRKAWVYFFYYYYNFFIFQALVNNAFSQGHPSEVLADKFNIQVTRRDIATLAGLNWLNDEVRY